MRKTATSPSTKPSAKHTLAELAGSALRRATGALVSFSGRFDEAEANLSARIDSLHDRVTLVRIALGTELADAREAALALVAELRADIAAHHEREPATGWLDRERLESHGQLLTDVRERVTALERYPLAQTEAEHLRELIRDLGDRIGSLESTVNTHAEECEQRHSLVLGSIHDHTIVPARLAHP